MESWTYNKAGIDLAKHRSMHSYVLSLIEKLNNELGYEVKGLGGYATAININGKQLVLHVDGVGTKTIVLQRLGKLKVAGWDCVAMNVNDVVCEGVKPVALVDYIAMPSSNEDLFKDVVEGIIEAAKYARVAMLGGETAILPDLVNGVDVVCVVLGVKDVLWNPQVEVGDIVVGISSWGLHANGYTLVRKILENLRIDYNETIEGVNLGEELSKPVAIYSNLVLELVRKSLVKGVAHITGGAFSKLKRLIGKDMDVILNMPRPPKIFELIMRLGNVDVDEMYKVFNMGIGMVLMVSRDYVEKVEALVEEYGFTLYRLGFVTKGTGKVILNTYYGKTVQL